MEVMGDYHRMIMSIMAKGLKELIMIRIDAATIFDKRGLVEKETTPGSLPTKELVPMVYLIKDSVVVEMTMVN